MIREAWDRAIARFEDGYGDGPPDLTDLTDLAGFLPLFEEEVLDGLGTVTVKYFRAEADRYRGQR